MMSNDFERNAGENAILTTVPSMLAEQAATTAVLEDLRHDGETIVNETIEAARDGRPFSWNVDPQDTARALTSAATLPWVIWSTGVSLACSMCLTPINLFDQRATTDK